MSEAPLPSQESYTAPKSWVLVMDVSVMCRRRNADARGLFTEALPEWPVLRMGTSGLEFRCADEDYGIGEPLSLSLHLPDARNFVIANAEVTAQRKEDGRTLVAVTFTELPPPLQRRIAGIMRKSGVMEAPQTLGEPTADAAPTEDLGAEIQARMSELIVNMDVYLDLLEMFAAGVNVDDFTPRPDHRSVTKADAVPNGRIPMFVLSPQGALKLNAAGEPAGKPVDYLQVPGADASVCFGGKCTSRIDLGRGLVCNPGCIFVFSYEEFPENNNVILCPVGSDALLGRIYQFGRTDRVVLDPCNEEGAPVVLDCPIHDAGYKLVARYEHF